MFPINHRVGDLFLPLPERRNIFTIALWVFRNFPITILIHIAITLALVGIGFADEFGAGVALIVWGGIFILIAGVRYTLIAYRIFTKNTPTVNGILIPIELIALLWASVSTTVSGLYFIDPTSDKVRYITHDGFTAGANLYFVWWYISMASITALSGTGYSSIIENNIATATVYGISIGLAYYAVAIIIAYFVTFWSELRKEEEEEEEEREAEVKRRRPMTYRNNNNNNNGRGARFRQVSPRRT